jgi:hypothetical protein
VQFHSRCVQGAIEECLVLGHPPPLAFDSIGKCWRVNEGLKRMHGCGGTCTLLVLFCTVQATTYVGDPYVGCFDCDRPGHCVEPPFPCPPGYFCYKWPDPYGRQVDYGTCEPMCWSRNGLPTVGLGHHCGPCVKCEISWECRKRVRTSVLRWKTETVGYCERRM